MTGRGRRLCPEASRGKCTLDAPSLSQSLAQGVGVDSEFRSPVCDSFRFTAPLHEMITSLIFILIARRSPIAILRRVAFVVVAALNGVVLGRSQSYVSKERREGVDPLIADCNSPSAVIGIFRMVLGIAPLSHRLPRMVFRGSRHAVFG